MNTNGTGTQFDAIENNIVGFRPAIRGVRGEFLQVLVMNGSKGVMRRVPALLLLIPLKHRKIDHPEELKILRVQQFVAIVVLLTGKQAKLAARLEESLL